jgi:hypothetical protein
MSFNTPLDLQIQALGAKHYEENKARWSVHHTPNEGFITETEYHRRKSSKQSKFGFQVPRISGVVVNIDTRKQLA